ncbi:unnamed protein product [Alopecurus aequalis]
MQGPKQFKQALLESLLVGLQKPGVGSRDMTSFHERKRAIRLAADAALVNARGADATRWSRTLQAAPELAYGRQITRGARSSPVSTKMILRRCHRPRCPRKAGMVKAPYSSADVLARAMVRKRTRVLKGIVPGGEGLDLDDECTLLGETLDYAVCLKAQVDVMQLLVTALQEAKAP